MSTTEAAAAVPAPAVASAVAAAAYTPRAWTRTAILNTRQHHLVGRFSYGVTPSLAKQVKKKGGATKWFEWQLKPSKIDDPAYRATKAWWPDLARSPENLWKRHSDGVRGGWLVMDDYQRWVIARRIRSKRQVLEVMTQFWENHLFVPTNGEQWFVHRVSYGETIRKHALGRFDQLLEAAITHPSMLIYLDNVSSTAKRPNENLARELLELHTVGHGKFTEADVKDAARVLTGWTADQWRTWTARYDQSKHATGPVKVKSFSHTNASADGRAVTRAMLKHLAHHPDTARRIARRLAVKFVGDNPSAALVDKLARVYLKNDTAIKPVLRTLVRTDAFRASVGDKVRDPVEEMVAVYRVLGAKVARPTSDQSAANAVIWQTDDIGATPFGWPRPDGTPIDNAAWSSTSRVLASLQAHWSMSGGWWPSKQVTYRTPKAWVPRSGMRFDELVDHLSRSLLHRKSTSSLLKACCEVTGVSPATKITHTHPLVRWQMPLMIATVLDSPAFFSR